MISDDLAQYLAMTQHNTLQLGLGLELGGIGVRIGGLGLEFRVRQSPHSMVWVSNISNGD